MLQHVVAGTSALDVVNLAEATPNNALQMFCLFCQSNLTVGVTACLPGFRPETAGPTSLWEMEEIRRLAVLEAMLGGEDMDAVLLPSPGTHPPLSVQDSETAGL